MKNRSDSNNEGDLQAVLITLIAISAMIVGLVGSCTTENDRVVYQEINNEK